MRRALCLLAVAVAVAVAVAAAIALPAAARTPSGDWEKSALAAAAPFIDRANDDWTRAIVSGNADALSAPYDEHGIFIRPDGFAVHGKAAVRDMYAKQPPGVKVLKAEIRSDGRAAHDPAVVYEWGTASMTIQRGKEILQKSGRYLTVWHREGSRWLITHNIAF